MTLTFRSFRA